MHRRSRLASTSSTLLLGLALTACGDDGAGTGTEGASASTNSPTSETSDPTGSPTGTSSAPTTDGPTTSPTTASTTTGPTTDTDPSDSTGEPSDCPYDPVQGKVGVSLELVASGFNHALHVVGDPIDQDVLYVVEHGGTIKRIEPGVKTAPAENWLDVSVLGGSGGNEQGLFSLAFHPDYANNGLIYIAHTPASGSGAVFVTEYSVSDGVVDTGSARDVIGIAQPFGNHNGGQIEFGPDGMLYFGLGDGGSGGDPCGSGQNGDALLGKILRIDPTADGNPDTTPGCPGGQCACSGLSGFDYTIPADNPFVGDATVRDEVWATGVRNPWRFSIDRDDGRMFIADVGQDAFEEVSVAVAGDNLGWNDMEGFNCFGGGCDTSGEPGGLNGVGQRLPIVAYGHAVGQSISGIGLYKGCEVPGWDGIYFYGDIFITDVFAVAYDGSTVSDLGSVAQLPDNLVPYGGGTNAYGDVFIAANPNPYFGGGPGSVFRVAPSK